MISSEWKYNVNIFVPKSYYFEEPEDYPNDKLKRMLEETVEKFIRENYSYDKRWCKWSRGCGYYVEEVDPDYSFDDIEKYKTDDPLGDTKFDEETGELTIGWVNESDEPPTEIIPFQTVEEKYHKR